MTDKEKDAVEYLSGLDKSKIFYNNPPSYNNLSMGGAIEMVLNLIQTQQEEIIKINKQKHNQSSLRRLNERKMRKYRTENKELKAEIEKKDKRTSDLEFALMDMVLQFADENEDSISTMGLSALEIAFNELNFDNPMSIKEVHKRYKILEKKYYQ